MKNFFIKQGTKHFTIEKARKHIEYLIDGNRASHCNTRIKAINDNVEQTYSNINREYEAYSKYKKENGGGRSSNATTTYILSLPEDLVHPTDEQWTDIYNQTIDNFCEFINDNQQRKEEIGFTGSNEKNRKNIEQYNALRLNPNVFKNNAVAVIHNEEKGQEKASHIHVIASNIQDGKYMKMLNQTAGQSFIKKAYDKAILDVLGLKPLDYIPKIDRLTDKEKEKLDLEDKEKFEKRMKNNSNKYKTSEKGKIGGRTRKRRTKPAYIAREEKSKSIENSQNKRRVKQNNNAQIILKKHNEQILKDNQQTKKEASLLAIESELKENKNDLLEFNSSFLEYINAIAENKPEDRMYLVESSKDNNYFSSENEAENFAKAINSKVEEPFLKQMKNYLSELFSKIFGRIEINEFESNLELYNKSVASISRNQDDSLKVKARINKTKINI